MGHFPNCPGHTAIIPTQVGDMKNGCCNRQSICNGCGGVLSQYSIDYSGRNLPESEAQSPEKKERTEP